jgi:hypothetical protein
VLVGSVTESRLSRPCFLVWGCNMGIRTPYIVNDLKHGTHARFMTIRSDGPSLGKGRTKKSASISEIVRVSQVESFTIYLMLFNLCTLT